MNTNNPNSGIEVKAIQWTDGTEEVVIHILDLDKMVTLTPEGARSLAFLLMETADYIEPPFGDPTVEEENFESLACFGPYETEFVEEDADEPGEDEEA